MTPRRPRAVSYTHLDVYKRQAVGSEALIADLNRVKFSFNPYNVNRLSLIAGAAAMEDEDYFRDSIAAIEKNRAWTTRELEALGFTVLPSSANYIDEFLLKK